MARTATITHEQILAAAREVFLEKGIRATVAEVAERAGIAGGSIFKRFKTKEDLFCAAMQTQMHQVEWFDTLARAAESDDVEDALLAIGREILAFFRKIMPLMMMAWSNA